MTGSPRRLHSLLAAALAALLIVSLATSARAAGGPPSCPAGATPGANPPKACVYDSWKSDHFTNQLTRTSVSVTHHIVNKGPYSYVAVAVRAGFSDAPLLVCPGGGVPLGDIPCQQGAPGIGVTGRYVPGKRVLDTSAAGSSVNVPTCTANAPTGTCTYDFRLYEDQLHGHWTGIVSVSVTQLTQNPANDLAQSGFEFPVSLTVPAPPKTHTPMSRPPSARATVAWTP